MAFIGTGFIDPKDYPFKKWIDEQKHLDCDEHRHTIKPIRVHISDMVGEEHLYCDKSQLCPEGKYRRPKKLMEAERKGFKSIMEMDTTEKKTEEEKKVKEQEDMKKRSQIMEEHARSLEDQLTQSMKALEDYKNLTEERFNKLAKMISGK